LEAPLLAVIMAFFTKYFSGSAENPEAYVFFNNENLPAYLLMSVVVFLFLGMTLSSEEIIKDRKILQRESFLNLSRGSYLHSKILIMFAISAIQALSYVVIGNLIFEIKGMMLTYWLILFSTSCFANLLGLNISAGLNSVITIYILVPFLLIPQILFCGVLVKYDKLHKSLTNYEYVPAIGNVMTSRWAYEALAVEQYKSNRYQREYFDIEQEISSADYIAAYLIPKLEGKINLLKQRKLDGDDPGLIQKEVQTVYSQLAELGKLLPGVPLHQPVQEESAAFDDSTVMAIKSYFSVVTDLTRRRVRNGKTQLDNLVKASIEQKGGAKLYTSFRNKYANESLSDLLLNRSILEKIMEKDGRLIRKYEPVYMKPTSRMGQAHLYAPNKQLGNLEIGTLWYNLMIIWVYTLVLYLTLRTDLLRKVINISETKKLIRRQSS